MDRVKALELLEDSEHCSQLSYVGYRRLLLRAGFSPEEVREASLQHGWNRLSAEKLM